MLCNVMKGLVLTALQKFPCALSVILPIEGPMVRLKVFGSVASLSYFVEVFSCVGLLLQLSWPVVCPRHASTC